MSKELDRFKKSTHFAMLGEHTAGLWKYNKMTDILIQIQKNVFPAHKAVLTCYSPYFKKLLIEPTGHCINKMRLKSITPKAFDILLTYMYTGELNVNCQTLADVYQASKKLEMHDITEKCSLLLTGSERNATNLLCIYVTAKRLGLRQTWLRALNSMAKRFEDIVMSKDFVELNVEQVCEFLSMDVIGARSEVIVFLAALKWLNQNYVEREQYIKQIMDNVRFFMMTLEEIVSCYHPPILPGIIEHVFVRNLITDATCYISAKMCGKTGKFMDYNTTPRQYLPSGHPLELWNVSECDVARNMFLENKEAAEKIQTYYKIHQLRERLRKRAKEIFKIQFAIRKYLNRRKSSNLENIINCQIKHLERPNVTRTIDLRRIDTLTINPILQRFLKNNNNLPNWTNKLTKHLNKVTGSIQLCKESILLTVGGMNPEQMQQIECSSSILRYTIENKWEKCSKLPLPRHHMAAVCLKDNLYCIGGCDLRETLKGNIVPTSSCFRFNYVHKTWDNMKSMHHSRMYHGAAVLFGIIYTVGGKNERNQLLSSIECYCINTDIWYELKNPLSCPRMGMGVTAHNGLLWITGGIVHLPKENKAYIVRNTECFNPKTNQWSFNFAKLPIPLSLMGFVEHKKKLYTIGGLGKLNNRISSLTDMYFYDDELDKWKKCSSLPSAKHGLSAASIDRKLFIIGGFSTNQTTNYSEFLCFENPDKSWMAYESVPFPICGTTIVTLPPLKN